MSIEEAANEYDARQLQAIAEAAQAAQQGILISTASMLAIGLLQAQQYEKNPKGAVNRALDLAQYMIDKVCGEKKDQETPKAAGHTN